MFDEVTLRRRLAFIRYLYSIGVEQSRQPEPCGAASILTFHDGVELFLQLASEHLDAGVQQPDFMAYWELLAKKLPNGALSQKEPMRRLNKSRVALKHHGTLPSSLDIEAFRASVTNFFEENTPLVFGLVFGSISLVSLVKCAEVRSCLEEAGNLIQEGKLEEALDKIATAFARLISEYEATNRERFARSPFLFGESFSWRERFFTHNLDSSLRQFAYQLQQFADKVGKSFESIQGGMKVLSLGLDYRRYVKFKLLTPHVTLLMDGGCEVVRLRENQPPSIDECQFSHDFVVESALHLQGFDIATEK
jgi:hypothetical protein